jgi:TonB family protein
MASGDTDQHQASYEHLLERGHESASGLRLGLLAAVAIHLAVFAITWPTLAGTRPAEPPPRTPKFFPVQPVEFEASRPRIEVPELSGRAVPVPAPVHQRPEPIEERVFEITPSEFTFTVASVLPTPPPTTATVPEVVDAHVDVSPPAVTHRIEPRYTGTAQRLGIEGAVVLSLLIDTEGRVADLTVLRGLPFGLTQNAVEAVREWRFEPCTFNDRPVRVRYTLTVVFRLDHRP